MPSIATIYLSKQHTHTHKHTHTHTHTHTPMFLNMLWALPATVNALCLLGCAIGAVLMFLQTSAVVWKQRAEERRFIRGLTAPTGKTEWLNGRKRGRKIGQRGDRYCNGEPSSQDSCLSCGVFKVHETGIHHSVFLYRLSCVGTRGGSAVGGPFVYILQVIFELFSMLAR